MIFATEADPAISIDEIGIATARHGGLLLRSAFQPVYALRGGELHAAAAASLLRPSSNGRPLPPLAFLAGLGAEERLCVERLAAAIHAVNHDHSGVAGLAHILGLGPALAASADAAAMLARIAERDDAGEAVPPDLVCGLRVADGAVTVELAALAAGLEAGGVRLALGGLAGEPPPLEPIRRLKPAIVRIDGAWFRRVAREPAARRLLAGLAAAFRDHGAHVLVEGIETRDQLATAIEMKADLLQGFLLSHPQPAGAVVERTVVRLADMLRPPAPVVPLFGRGR